MNDDDQLVDMYLTRNAMRQATLEMDDPLGGGGGGNAGVSLGDGGHGDGGGSVLPRGLTMAPIYSQVNLDVGDDEDRDKTLKRLKSVEAELATEYVCVCV